MSWDSGKPEAGIAANLLDNRIRTNNEALEAAIDQDHDFTTSGTQTGKHNMVSLIETDDLGTGAEGLPILGAQTADGKAELVFTDEDDNDIQITKAGVLNIGVTDITDVILDEDDLSSDDETKVPSQQSVKAYVDSELSSLESTLTDYIDEADTTLQSNIESTYLTGQSVQVVNTMTKAVGTGTTQIPLDNSIPQITEGDQYMTQAITPTSASNKLKIEVIFVCAAPLSSRDVTVALFQDTTANALAAVCMTSGTANGVMTIPLTYYMAAGTTSATTFRVRAGMANAGTLTFNGSNGTQIFGGICTSSITITEIQV
jgi:hypothetical protein